MNWLFIWSACSFWICLTGLLDGTLENRRATTPWLRRFVIIGMLCGFLTMLLAITCVHP